MDFWDKTSETKHDNAKMCLPSTVTIASHPPTSETCTCQVLLGCHKPDKKSLHSSSDRTRQKILQQLYLSYLPIFTFYRSYLDGLFHLLCCGLKIHKLKKDIRWNLTAYKITRPTVLPLSNSETGISIRTTYIPAHWMNLNYRWRRLWG